MATAGVHRLEAIANREHAEWLLTTNRANPVVLRWAATSTFYSALHALSAHLVERGVMVASHADRTLALAHPSNGVPPHVFAAYQYLQRRSIGARYLVWSFTPAQVRGLIRQQLSTIFAFVGM